MNTAIYTPTTVALSDSEINDLFTLIGNRIDYLNDLSDRHGYNDAWTKEINALRKLNGKLWDSTH